MLNDRLLEIEALSSSQQNDQRDQQENFETQIEALSSKYEERLCIADSRLLELEQLCLLKDSQARQLHEIANGLQSQLSLFESQRDSLQSELHKYKGQVAELQAELNQRRNSQVIGTYTKDDSESKLESRLVQTHRRKPVCERIDPLSIWPHRFGKTEYSVSSFKSLYIEGLPLPALRVSRRVGVCQILSHETVDRLTSCRPPLRREALQAPQRESSTMRAPSPVQTVSPLRAPSQVRASSPMRAASPMRLSFLKAPRNSLVGDSAFGDRLSFSPRRHAFEREKAPWSREESPWSREETLPKRAMTSSLGWSMPPQERDGETRPLLSLSSADYRRPCFINKQRPELSQLRQTLRSTEALIGTRGRLLSAREITMRFNGASALWD
eukprot:Gregarina_sp_Poly_1__171@NODE_103_length_14370_cov_80_074250_g90_i0_p4_GENE_NODE_103_length_14370_cov_80_074250_g90_i0NODE_103_length_14370_cov_80_074250_g90_i0_p4_ORF_typecomplete_len384_score64_59zfC4H2/PF10146_9/0_0029Cast/PF10174_9/0_0032WEMBL/PF05701_11/1_1e03WEMBL/PF05701_11/0_014TTKRSYEDQ/PF10212_9/0_017CALCOCO1/PF07888_11/0_0046DUF1759/PF03564_15/0_045Rab5bind/PF09311_11/0_042HemX/PF04375_14/0_33FapA/PF03961_13/0_27Dynamitin/PF04912_14/0_49Bacillus_HBL/PF05791_11/0_75Atg14/PF10186_9/0_08